MRLMTGFSLKCIERPNRKREDISVGIWRCCNAVAIRWWLLSIIVMMFKQGGLDEN